MLPTQTFPPRPAACHCALAVQVVHVFAYRFRMWDDAHSSLQGGEPDAFTSQLIFVSYTNIHDGASEFYACDGRLSPHFL